MSDQDEIGRAQTRPVRPQQRSRLSAQLRSRIQPAWLREPDAVKYSGFSKSMLWALAGAGDIQTVKAAGRVTVFNRESIDQFIARRAAIADVRSAERIDLKRVAEPELLSELARRGFEVPGSEVVR